jgi:hypothetical protein
LAEKSSWDRQTDGKNLVWFGEIERKLAQIINDYLCLLFFLLIILWMGGFCAVFEPHCVLKGEILKQHKDLN